MRQEGNIELKTIQEFKLWIGPMKDLIKAPIKRFLSVQLIDGIPTVWAEIDTDLPVRTWQIMGMYLEADLDKYSIMEGEPIYIGTILDHRNLIWHYYANIREENNKET